MKIVDVTTTVVGNPWKNWVFVQLLTDEGIVGIGEATGGLSTKPNEAAVHELKPLYLGQDPGDVHALWDRMHKGLFLGQNAAMSGIEMACWDILGKALIVPSWRILGGGSDRASAPTPTAGTRDHAIPSSLASAPPRSSPSATPRSSS